MARPRVVEISRWGPPEVLRVREVERPEPGAGSVRIAVAAAGVNYADVLGRLGLYGPAPKAPYVPGFEVAGTIQALGPGVTAWRPGERVIGGLRFGGYASEVVARADRLLRLPEGWSPVEGAGFLATYATAHHALVGLGRVGPGARVLVHAGAGGLGTAAIQIARHLGARVVATAGGADKARFCEERGAHAAVDYLARGWEARARAASGGTGSGTGFDLVLDSVLGTTLRSSLALLAPMGHLVLVGAASFTPRNRRNWLVLGARWLRLKRLDPLALISSNRTVSGFNLLLLMEDDAFAARLGSALEALARSGTVRPVIDRTFPLEAAAAAHEHLQARRSRGKVVLEVG